MTTPLLQQALEALELAKNRFCGQEWVPRIQSAIGDIDAAITAIQAHLSTSQAEQVPLTDEQRKQITAMWSKQNRNYTVADIIDAVERAHGITKEPSK